MSAAALSASCFLAPRRAATAASRDAAVAGLLERVPAFVVTNQQGLPYLTEIDIQGRRSGAVYLGVGEAAALLEDVRMYDPNATLAIVPLARVYPDVSKSVSEAVAARDVVPQPSASATSDMRLFRLQPLSDERAEEAALVPGSSSVPLFYIPSLVINVEGEERRPYFMRSTDLLSTWQRVRSDDAGEPSSTTAAKPALRVVGLERLLRQMESEELEVVPILLPPSETAEVLNLPRRTM
ncbi:MAG: hypothetical protein SGPRY_004487 [Prymnesium sp.]